MAEQTRKQKTTTSRTTDDEVVEEAAPAVGERREAQGGSHPRPARRSIDEVLENARTSSSPTSRRADSKPPWRCRSSPRATTRSSFPELLRRLGAGPPVQRHPRLARRGPARHDVRRDAFVDGVVMAGDRRATAGNLISHR